MIANLIVFAILLPDIRDWTIGLAFVFIAYTIIQLFDKRKDQWAWWVIVFGIVLSIAVSVCYVILFDLYLYFVVIGLQVVILSAVFCVFKKK